MDIRKKGTTISIKTADYICPNRDHGCEDGTLLEKSAQPGV
jgi:hypothetical protein